MNIPTCLKLAVFVVGLAALTVPSRAESQFDDPPTPVRTQAPRYPEALRRDGTTGMVSISVTIDEKGAVVAATVTKSTNSGFDAAALDAVKQWKFKPAKKGGQPVSCTVVLPIRFTADQ